MKVPRKGITFRVSPTRPNAMQVEFELSPVTTLRLTLIRNNAENTILCFSKAWKQFKMEMFSRHTQKNLHLRVFLKRTLLDSGQCRRGALGHLILLSRLAQLNAQHTDSIPDTLQDWEGRGHRCSCFSTLWIEYKWISSKAGYTLLNICNQDR